MGRGLFTGLVGYGGVIADCLLSNGNKQAHPSYDTAKPARATHKSTETKSVMPHPVRYAFNRRKEYLSHTLWHKLWKQTLSACAVYTAGPSLAIHLVAKSILMGSLICRGDLGSVCAGVGAGAWRNWLKSRRSTFVATFAMAKICKLLTPSARFLSRAKV